MTAILREVDRGTYQAPNKITVAAWTEEWLSTFCGGEVKLLTFQSYQGIIKNHIVPAIGRLKSGKPRTIEPPIAFEYLRAERVKQLENRLMEQPGRSGVYG